MAALAAFNACDAIVRIVSDQGHGVSIYVHRSLLVNSCDYLNAALTFHDNDEGNSPIAIHTDITKTALFHFGQFVYTGKLKPGNEPFKTIAEVLNVYKWTVHHLHCGEFRDALTDEAIKILTYGLTSTATHEIVRAVLNDFEDIDGGLSMLLVDWTVRSPLVGPYMYAEINYCLSNGHDTNPIHRALAQAFLEVKMNEEEASQAPWLYNPCQYHEHLPTSSCMAKMTASSILRGSEKSPLLVSPKTPQKRNPKRKTRNSGLDEELDSMVLNDEEEIECETPTKKPRPAPEVWTNEERLHFLNVALGKVSGSWSDVTKEHNKTYWAKAGSKLERSAGALRSEYVKHMGTADRPKTFMYLSDKIEELKSEVEATKQDVPELAALDDIDGPDTNNGSTDASELWTSKEEIKLLRLFYENPDATDQEISDLHNCYFWGGNQERSVGDITAKYLDTIGVSRKLTTLRKIPAKIAEMEEGGAEALEA